jgi:hypothetical protein
MMDINKMQAGFSQVLESKQSECNLSNDAILSSLKCIFNAHQHNVQVAYAHSPNHDFTCLDPKQLVQAFDEGGVHHHSIAESICNLALAKANDGVFAYKQGSKIFVENGSETSDRITHKALSAFVDAGHIEANDLSSYEIVHIDQDHEFFQLINSVAKEVFEKIASERQERASDSDTSDNGSSNIPNNTALILDGSSSNKGFSPYQKASLQYSNVKREAASRLSEEARSQKNEAQRQKDHKQLMGRIEKNGVDRARIAHSQIQNLANEHRGHGSNHKSRLMRSFFAKAG